MTSAGVSALGEAGQAGSVPRRLSRKSGWNQTRQADSANEPASATASAGAEQVVQRRIVPGDEVEEGVGAHARERRFERLRAGRSDGGPDDDERARSHRTDNLPVGTASWERPRSGGEDGDAHRHPSRCRSRHAEMGGRSHPRPRSADRHPRSAGRGTTESAPATCGTGGVHAGTRFPCTRTPMWHVHSRCSTGTRFRVVKTGPPTVGSNARP